MPAHHPSVPGEQRRRCDAEGSPASPGKQSIECRQERTIRRRKGLALDLPSERGHFVAQSEELDLVGVMGVRQENDELQKTADGEVDESPELTLGSCPASQGR